MAKYILSDRETTYYLYESGNFPAVAFRNFFPRFFANGKWRRVDSFCEFSDNAVEVSRKRFVERLKQLGAAPDAFPDFDTKPEKE